jgi:hypothetical protein
MDLPIYSIFISIEKSGFSSHAACLFTPINRLLRYVVLQFNRHFCRGKRHRMFVWAKFEKWVDKGGYSDDTDTKEK